MNNAREDIEIWQRGADSTPELGTPAVGAVSKRGVTSAGLS